MSSSDVKRILCYGDSNTWGYQPITGQRYDEKTRWTSIAQKILGSKYQIIEAGLNGRTTVFEDPFDPYRNGLTGIGYALLESMPLDLIVIALGTNDLKFTGVVGAARGLASLVTAANQITTRIASDRLYSSAVPAAANEAPKILIVSPILIHPEIKTINPQTSFSGGYEKSLELAKAFERVAVATGSYFVDASKVATPSELDGVHMMPDSHFELAKTISCKIKEIFSCS